MGVNPLVAVAQAVEAAVSYRKSICPVLVNCSAVVFSSRLMGLSVNVKGGSCLLPTVSVRYVSKIGRHWASSISGVPAIHPPITYSVFMAPPAANEAERRSNTVGRMGKSTRKPC